MATTQKITWASCFFPSLFRDYITTIKHCVNCQIYTTKTRVPPSPLYLAIMVNPFCKWGIDFMECRPPSSSGHKYIIIIVDYFTKWAETMPTFNNLAETTTWFFFNHTITHFGVPKQLVSNHGTNFQNDLFQYLSCILGFVHKFSMHYYPHTNN